jgi:hypothetical protein
MTTDEITFDEARAREVKAVIAEFPLIKCLSGPEPVDRSINIWDLRYCCVVIETGIEFDIVVQRHWDLRFMQEGVRRKIKANLN